MDNPVLPTSHYKFRKQILNTSLTVYFILQYADSRMIQELVKLVQRDTNQIDPGKEWHRTAR
jgi:hypothetical protein